MPVYIDSGYLYRGTQIVMVELAKKGCLGNPKSMLGLHHVSESYLG